MKKMSFSWFNSRKLILISFTIDISLFIFLFKDIFIEYGHKNLIGLITLGWLILSYILGRYKLKTKWSALEIIKYFSKSLFFFPVAILSLYFTRSLENIVLNEFLTKIIQLSLISSFLQFYFARFILRNLVFNENWLFIGSNNEYSELSKYQKANNNNSSLKKYNFSNLYTENRENISGVVLDEINSLTGENKRRNDLNSFINFKINGLKTITKVEWAERILQRVPSNIITDRDLIKWDLISPNSSIQNRIKRLADIILSLIIIAVAIPFIILALILIKIEDRGPLIYKQTRCGFKGETFQIYKLRTMYVDAEKNGPEWSKKNDKRLTKIGTFLRKTRLDEIPQLFLVFIGQMSLIGPRPERPEIEVFLKKEIKHYPIKYFVKPGLSGWAQVNYPYGASIEDSYNKLSYDIYYIKNFSIWLDILIFFKTIKLVFNLQGSTAKK